MVFRWWLVCEESSQGGNTTRPLYCFSSSPAFICFLILLHLAYQNNLDYEVVWVPSHCGLQENERADYLANAVANRSSLVQQQGIPVTADSFKQIMLKRTQPKTIKSLSDVPRHLRIQPEAGGGLIESTNDRMLQPSASFSRWHYRRSYVCEMFSQCTRNRRALHPPLPWEGHN